MFLQLEWSPPVVNSIDWTSFTRWRRQRWSPRLRKLLDLRAKSTYQHYDQEYDFPEADPLFGPPPRTMDLIPEAVPSQRSHRRGRRSGLLVRLRRRARRSLLLSILLTNVQSPDNKVDEIQARVAFQRDIRDYNILCVMETWMPLDMLSGISSATGLLHASRRQRLTPLWEEEGRGCMLHD